MRRILIGLVAIIAATTACSSETSESLVIPLAPVMPADPAPTLDPNDPVVIGDGSNTQDPSGENKTGIDATDDLCDELRANLDTQIDKTLADLRSSGADPAYLPSRSDLEDTLGDALRANGCAGF